MIAADDQLGAKAITLLGRVFKIKRKTAANKMLGPMVKILFKVICAMYSDEGDDEEEIFGSAETNTPSVVAEQTLDKASIHIIPEKSMPVLLSHVQPALASEDPVKPQGASYFLVVMAEGCSENIKRKFMMDFLKCTNAGIKRPTPAVRNNYAHGQSSDCLQHDMSSFADTILMVLFGYLDVALREIEGHTEANESPSPRCIFYVLETYSVNLVEKFIPMLPDLTNRLLAIVIGVFPVCAKELAVSCIGAVTGSVEEGIFPHFDAIMQPLKGNLIFKEGNPDSAVLFNQCLDTLASLARDIVPDGFTPKLAEECNTPALGLMKKHDDPDVHRCAYNLFSAVSFFVEEEMLPILPNIVLLSVASKEGISLQEKEGAIIVKEISVNARPVFVPYLQVRGLLLPVCLLLLVQPVFAGQTSSNEYFWPIILAVAGFVVLCVIFFKYVFPPLMNKQSKQNNYDMKKDPKKKIKPQRKK